MFAAAAIPGLPAAFAADAWGPERIEIVCYPDIECLPDDKRSQLEGYANEILREFRKMGFAPPLATEHGNRLGNFAPGRDGTQVNEIYYTTNESSGFARYWTPCTADGGFLNNDQAYPLELGPKLVTFPPPIAYWFIAHEIFHALQYSQPAFTSGRHCRPPAWMAEGSADAVAIWLMEKHFGSNGYLPSLSANAAQSRYGLRPYHVGFATASGRYMEVHDWVQTKSLGYRTSSFWRFLGDRYHDGSMAYLADWLRQPNNSSDWLSWLNQRLRNDRKIGQYLYLVYPEFQANFARWAPARFKGLSEDEWRDKAYNGCETVTLTPDQPVRGLSFELEPIAARCVRIKVGALASDKVVSVKLMAYDDDPYELENLHLSAVQISPTLREYANSDFDCYRDSPGMGRKPVCVDKPFTGERSKISETAAGFARTWLNRYQAASSGSLENTYMISHTPLKPSDRQHADRKVQRVRLSIGLEEVVVETTERGKARQAMATVDGRATQPIPMRGSEELGNAPRGTDALSKQAFNMGINPADRVEFFAQGITQIQLLDRSPDDIPESELAGALSFSFSPKDGPIPFGSSGSFDAMMNLGFEMVENFSPDAVIMPVPAEQRTGTIRVVEFSDNLLHLEITGYYCRAGNMKNGRCRKIETATGTVRKPFGWAYDGAQPFTSIETPGMAQYRELFGDSGTGGGMPGLPGIIGNPAGMGGMGGMGTGCVTLPDGISADAMDADLPICGSSQSEAASANAATAPIVPSLQSSHSQSTACACTCEEMREAQADAEALSQRAPADGGVPDMSGVNTGRLMCVFQCAAQYAACEE